MTHRSCRLPVAAAAALLSGSLSLAQSPTENAPQVRIESPAAEDMLSGPTVLRGTVAPASAVTSVTFFVDGRQVCELAASPFECEWDAGRDVAARQVRMVVSFSGGGRVVRTVRTRRLEYVEKVDVNAVQVTVSVTDDNGRYVAGLPKSAFRVFEDDQPQTISNFASTDVPLELVVAVDISGSMMPAMTQLKTAVKGFLTAVPPRDEVTLLGFNDSIFPLTRRATDPAQRIKAVDRLAPWGATALYDAAVRGISTLGKQTGRRALVIFTDGEDQGSRVTLEDVERRLQASDVVMYMIGQGRGLTQEYLKRVMQRLTVPTGGRVLTTPSIDKLRVAFEELLDELSNQYLLSYEPTNKARDERLRSIRVEVEGHRHVRARNGYRAVAPR
jgi:Ca-activated chloride channel family protein